MPFSSTLEIVSEGKTQLGILDDNHQNFKKSLVRLGIRWMRGKKPYEGSHKDMTNVWT